MSDAPAEAAKKAGGKKKKMIMLIGGISLLAGGGAAGGFFVAGGMSHAEVRSEDPNRPQLVLKGENPDEIAAKWTAKAHEQGEDHAGPEDEHAKGIDLPHPKSPTRYQATYFQIPAPFTSNVADSDAYAQISIAVSSYYDGRVIQALQTHELAIRSAILMMLAQEEEVAIATPQGKEKLQKKLVSIINDVLKQQTGYGGVDNVYFTNFVIQ